MPSVIDDVKNKISSFAGLDRLEEAVLVRINGEIYESWESIQIDKNIESMTSGFSISMTDRWRDAGSKWPIKPGQQVKINIGSDQVLNGYIDDFEVSISNDERIMTAMGRDKTGDLVDCSIIGTSQLNNVSIQDIADRFAKELFGINVIIDGDIGDKFSTWTINQGESVAENLMRAAKMRGLLLLSDSDGNLVITNRTGKDLSKIPSTKYLQPNFDFTTLIPSKNKTSSVDLIQGENVLSARARYDNSVRFSDYVVKGQAKGADNFFGKKVTEIQASAKDLGISRFRPLVLIAENAVDQNGAQRRANWEAINRASSAVDAEVSVQGWRQSPNGPLWDINNLVNCEIGFIGINSKMLISGVSYIKDQNGTYCQIRLTRPDAFDLKSEVKKENDVVDTLGWSLPKEQVKKIKEILGS